MGSGRNVLSSNIPQNLKWLVSMQRHANLEGVDARWRRSARVTDGEQILPFRYGEEQYPFWAQIRWCSPTFLFKVI